MGNKVSINAWEKLLPNLKEEQVITVRSKYTEDTIDVSIKRFISTEDYMNFVKIVTEACFDMNDGSYIPQAHDIAFDVQLIQQFTNLNFGKSVDKLYALAQCSDIIERIVDTIGENLTSRLKYDITESLRWHCECRSKSSKADELYDAAIGLLNSFSDMADVTRDNMDDNNIAGLVQALKKFNNTEDIVKAIVHTK